MNAAGKKYAVRGYTAGSNWKKNSGKPVFLCESDGKGAENRASREWIWGAAGEKMEDTCTLQAFDGELVIC